MTAKERILMIRLMKKAQKHPAYAKALGIEASGAVRFQKSKFDPKSLTNA